MKPERIQARVAADGGIAPVQQSLAALAAGLDIRFLLAGETLATVVDGFGRMIGSLDAIIGAIDAQAASAAVDGLKASAARLLALGPLQEGRVEDLGTVRRATADLDTHVMGIRERLRILRVNGTNLSIAAAGSSGFSHFISGMFERLDAADALLAGMVARLHALQAGVADTLRSARLVAGECAKVIPLVPERLTDDAMELQAHQAMLALAAEGVRAIAREMHGRVAVILGTLQIGDISRQRIEHVVAALQLVSSEADPRARAHLLGLLVAQLDEIAAELERETGLLVSSLRALGPDTRKLADLVEECEAGEGSHAFIHRLERGLTEVEALTRQLRAINRESVAMSLVIADAMDDLGPRLEDVRAVRAALRHIAVDALRQGHKLGEAGRAVAAVAEEIGDCTEALDQAVDGVAWAMRELATVGLSIRHIRENEAEADPSRQLSQSLSLIREACRRADQGLSEGRIDARELVGTLVEASERVEAELGIAVTISEIADRLRGLAPIAGSAPAAGSEAAIRALLLGIEPLYTMAREREVHRSFLLPGMTLAALDNADDEDGLF